jgi:hypothetical protein
VTRDDSRAVGWVATWAVEKADPKEQTLADESAGHSELDSVDRSADSTVHLTECLWAVPKDETTAEW